MVVVSGVGGCSWVSGMNMPDGCGGLDGAEDGVVEDIGSEMARRVELGPLRAACETGTVVEPVVR